MSNSFAELDEQLAQLKGVGAFGVSPEVLEWKKKAEEKDKKIQALESKLRALVEGVKEERTMQQKNFEEMATKLADSETQNEILSEKLTRLVSIVKQQRTALESNTPQPKEQLDTSQFTKEIAGLKNQIASLQGEKSNIATQYSQLQKSIQDMGSSHNLQQQQNEQLIAKLKSENQSLADQAQKAKREVEQLKTSLEEQERKYKSALENISKLSSSSSNESASSPGSKVLAPSSSVSEEKMNTLLAAVKKERARVKTEMDELQQKLADQEKVIIELQSKEFTSNFAKDAALEQSLHTAETKIAELEEQLAKAKHDNDILKNQSSTSDSLAASTALLNELDALADDIPPPPPDEEDVPPPPMEDLPASSKPKLNAFSPTPKKTTANPMAPSGGNIVDELKKGIQLKKTETPPKKQTQKPAMDLSSIGAQAMERAKQRQERMMKTNQPRKSVKLTSLLTELDTLSKTG